MRSRNRLTLALSLSLAACAGHVGGPELAARSSRPRVPVPDVPVKVGSRYQVAGRRYVPTDARDYDEVGLASWYSSGGSTANGERFDADAVTAAHTTLPLPCYVEVTALATGRTILVRINDRGPFAADRIIDLSRGAARQLGIERQGLAPVRVRRVEPTAADRLALRSGLPAEPRTIASPTMLANLDARYRLRRTQLAPAAPFLVGTGQRPTPGRPMPAVEAVLASLEPPASAQDIEVPASGPLEADMLRDELASLGPLAPASAAANTVRIGPFADPATASAVLAQVKARGYARARLVPAPANPLETAGNRTRMTP